MPEKLSIVGIGGTTSPGSSTEQALQIALRAAAAEGAEVTWFDGAALCALPHYAPGVLDRSEEGRRLVEAVREAHGLVIASPGYHGSISGLVKNAIDYVEETSKDARVYLDGLPVGLIVTAYGWQATGSTLATMRSIVHALRGWPTPLGAAIRAVSGMFRDGQCTDAGASSQLELVGKQVVEFARLRKAAPSILSTGPVEE
ncbi:NAD(P)H-dependent oxidoreductase [Sphingomonas sp. ID1715]|uniref:NADPH-dependent FMN reductase n=1 Tax=Sphingomonas sp. ID1715 TaxID=1656898 RepID=UPI001489A822|nr:NADPH-dependent FMN reductase [Sphingomonas sp. ID1715]NNM78703.1 NAD(P)H-dependent oxidoreductase [Sphingomonas sp. ID1715]